MFYILYYILYKSQFQLIRGEYIQLREIRNVGEAYHREN